MFVDLPSPVRPEASRVRPPHSGRDRHRRRPLLDLLEDRTLLSLRPTLTTLVPPAVAPE